jgi:hypothetical protein
LGIIFQEQGAYFLVALPALSIGVAAVIEQLAVWSERSLGRLGPAAMALMIAYAFLAMGHDNYRNQPNLADFDDTEWLQAFGEYTQGRGVFLAQDTPHQKYVSAHLGLQSEDLRFFIMLPPEELQVYMDLYRPWSRNAADNGDPLYIAEQVFDLAPTIPVLQTTLDFLAEEFTFTHIDLGGGFGVWKGE